MISLLGSSPHEHPSAEALRQRLRALRCPDRHRLRDQGAGRSDGRAQSRGLRRGRSGSRPRLERPLCLRGGGSKMSGRWFRFYDDAINDPKLLRLSDKAFRGWNSLLCVASKNGGTSPPTDDIAFMLRMKPGKVAILITELVNAGLLDNRDGVFSPHNWDTWQYTRKESDGGSVDAKGRYIYMVSAGSAHSAIKIGISKNPWARIVELQTGYPDKLSIVATFKTKKTSETDIHDMLAKHRRQGEWFDLPASIMGMITSAHEAKSDYAALLLLLRSELRILTTENDRSSYVAIPEQKQTTESEQSRADAPRADLSISEKVLRTDLMEAFGASKCPDLARTSDWLAKGYASGMIVEVVRELLARKPDIGSLAYFDAKLAERHAKRPSTPSER